MSVCLRLAIINGVGRSSLYWTVPTLLLFLHAWYYYPFISDDALISLRYSARFLQGKGLTWNNDFPVEGYSNLSWVLLAALAGKVGINLIDGLRLLAFFCFSGVLFLNYRLWRNVTEFSGAGLIASQLFFVLCAPIAIWTVGGLEQPLVVLCAVSAVYWIYRHLNENTLAFLWLASLSLGVICITRPDSPLLCVGLALGIWWLHGFSIKKTWRAVLVLGLLPIIFVVGQLWFRRAFYGEWVPNTAYIKLAPSPAHILGGVSYIVQGFAFLLPWSFLLIRYLVKQRAIGVHPLVKLVLPAVILWLGYVVFIGGDIFPGLRHLVVIISLLLLISPLLFTQLTQESSRIKLMLLVFVFLIVQFFSPSSILAKLERWEWHGQVLANVLNRAFGEDKPLIAVSAAGTLPYFSNFPAIDMLGLNDHFIARNPDNDPSQARIGHGHGNAQYIIDRNPDIVSFYIPSHRAGDKPFHLAEKNLFKTKHFQENFLLVRVGGHDPYPYIGNFWFNKKGSVVGVRYGARNLYIPGYLFSTVPQSYVAPGQDKELELLLEPGMEAHFSNIDLPEGNLSIAIDSSDSLYFEWVLNSQEGVRELMLRNNTAKTVSLRSVSISWD